jgi:hypothetical protein
MRSHRRRRVYRRLRAAALGLAAGALLVAPAAFALPTTSATGHAYDKKIATLSPSELSASWGENPDGSKIGDTPADYPGTGAMAETPKVGDTPADFPGTQGSPDVLVAPIAVPGHTIVREANDVLPLILAGAALLIALATAAFTLRGVLTARRTVVRPSH